MGVRSTYNRTKHHPKFDSKKVYEHQREKSDKSEENKDKGDTATNLEQQKVKPNISSELEESKETGSSESKETGSSESTRTGDSDPHQASGQISISVFSASGNLFAVCDDYKQLTVWRTKTEWESISTRMVPRRCVTLAFDHKEENIYIADKSGDVYQYSLSKPTDSGVLLLGHISMLLDVAISPDDKFIVTADRDEKIRVSCLPNAYTIHTFCLGHTQFVSRVAMIPWLKNNTLVSGSGDGTLKFWDYTRGQQLYSISLNSLEGTVDSEGADSANGSKVGSSADDDVPVETRDKLATVTCISCCSKRKLMAVAVSNSPTVVVYRLSETNDGLQCTQLTTFNCGVSPWSICYDHSGQLWVLRPIESEPLLVYTACEETEGNLKFEELQVSQPDTSICRIATQINQDKQFFQGAYGQESFYSTLHKNQIDNMYSYLQRKQQRIDHHKLKQQTHEQKTLSAKQRKQQHKQKQKQVHVKGQGSSDKDIPIVKKLKTN